MSRRKRSRPDKRAFQPDQEPIQFPPEFDQARRQNQQPLTPQKGSQ